MSMENVRKIFARLRDYGAYIGFISGGEATLVPYLDEILLEAKKTFTSATTLVTGLYNKTPVIQKFGRVALENDIHIQTSLDGLGELGDNLRGVKDFASTVLGHMSWLSENRGTSRSLLYANIVLNNMNLEQVPELVKRANDIGWKTTIGMYHSLTSTTRTDDELRIRPGKKLEKILQFLDGNHEILNLNSYITGIKGFIEGVKPNFCAFVDAPALVTRTTIMENGDLHLCYGGPIGNLLEQNLHEIFSGQSYQERVSEYRTCEGCWTTCYTQRYLLIHPRSVRELYNNIMKVRGLRT